MDIFQNLASDMDTEGRYLFLNCIANQLRYPNSHTHYFSCCLLYLFAEANTEAIQEQITRYVQFYRWISEVENNNSLLQSAVREINCQQTPPLGSPHHLH